MPSLNDLVAGLGSRLSDPLSGNSHYALAEAQGYVIDALRLWNALTGYWRARDIFPAQGPGVRWYDLTTVLVNSSLVQSVTDAQLLGRLSGMLLEVPGTDQFSPGAILAALTRRRDQFLGDSACYLSAQVIPMGATPVGRVTLPGGILDIRRLAWVDGTTTPPTSYALSREDEFTVGKFSPDWFLPGIPTAYVTSVTLTFVIQVTPSPRVPGSLDIVSVSVGPTLTGLGVAVGVPDDLAMALVWGAMADLLGGDQPQSDPLRATYAEGVYQEFVSLARGAATVLQVQVDGVPALLGTVAEEDAFNSGWENSPGLPSRVVLAGANLVALSPPSAAGAESITVDLVTRAPIPSDPAADLGLSGDLGDVILDYAEHEALWKQGGQEFAASATLRQRFLAKAVQANSKLRANALILDALRGKAQKPRRERSTGADQVTPIGASA